MEKTFESTLDKIFPSRVKKGFVKALVRQVVWAWKSVFGSQDTETRNNLKILARIIGGESDRTKSKIIAQKDPLFKSYAHLRSHLSAESRTKLDQVRDSFNQSVTNILDREALVHYGFSALFLRASTS